VIRLTHLARSEFRCFGGVTMVSAKATKDTELERLGPLSGPHCAVTTRESEFLALQAWATAHRPSLTHSPPGPPPTAPSLSEEGHVSLVDLVEGPFVQRVAFWVPLRRPSRNIPPS